MDKPLAYSHRSRIGTFWVKKGRDGFWHLWCGDEPLGEYNLAQQAIESAAGGYCDWPAGGVDCSTLGLSWDIAEWAPHWRVR